MTYTVLFLCQDDNKLNVKHEANDYNQAEYFFWAMVRKLTKAHEDIDIHTWQLTLHFVDKQGNNTYKYNFSKM